MLHAHALKSSHHRLCSIVATQHCHEHEYEKTWLFVNDANATQNVATPTRPSARTRQKKKHDDAHDTQAPAGKKARSTRAANDCMPVEKGPVTRSADSKPYDEDGEVVVADEVVVVEKGGALGSDSPTGDDTLREKNAADRNALNPTSPALSSVAGAVSRFVTRITSRVDMSSGGAH